MKIKAIYMVLLFSLLSCKENKTQNENPKQDTISVATDRSKSDTIPEDNSVPAGDPINDIKKEFSRINAAVLAKKHYTYQCDELMAIDYYYEGDNVVKAVIDYGTVGDHYQKSEFYYKDGKLFFFYDFIEGGPACEGCEMKLEQRYYVKDDLVIKYIKNKKEEKCTTCNFSKRSTPYRALQASETLDFKTAFCS